MVRHSANLTTVLKFYLQALRSKAVGGRGRGKGASTPPKFSVDVPFFADKPFKCGIFEESNQKYRRKSTSKITSKLK